VHRGVGPLGIPAVALVTLVLAGGAARAQDGAAEAGRAFDEAYAAFGEAYRQGDPAAVTALYWHDAYYLAPGDEILKGDVGRHFAWLSSFDGGMGPLVEFEIVDREVAGGLAYDIGYYTIRRSDAPAGSGSRGKFIVIWKQGENGAWRIHADGFSEVGSPDGAER
jgi:ketosteroid isomerase-like protein